MGRNCKLQAFFKRGKYKTLNYFSVDITSFLVSWKKKRTQISKRCWNFLEILPVSLRYWQIFHHSPLTAFLGNAKITQVPVMSRRKLRDSAGASRLSSSFAEDERGIHYAKSTMKFPRFAHVCLLNQSVHPDNVYLNGMGKWARSNLVALDHTEASVPKLLTKSHWAGWQKKFGELILDQICIQPRCFPVS